MHIVLRPAFVLQAVLGTLAARCFATSGISSYRLVVDLPSTFERAELVLIEGQDPLIAIRNFARAHPLGLDAKERLSDHLCSIAFANCRYPRLLPRATAYDSLAHRFIAHAGNAQDRKPVSTLPFINTGGRWESNPAIAAALAISVGRMVTRQRVLSPVSPTPSSLDVAVRLVNDRDDYRWRATLTMLRLAARGTGIGHGVRFVGTLDVANRNASQWFWRGYNRPTQEREARARTRARAHMLLNQNDQPACRASWPCCAGSGTTGTHDAVLPVLAYATARGFCDIAVPDFTFWSWPPLYRAGGYDAFCTALSAAGTMPPRTRLAGWAGRTRSSTWGGAGHPRRLLQSFSVAYPGLLEVVDSSPAPAASTSAVAMSLVSQVQRWAAMVDVEGNGYSGRLKILLFSRRVLLLVQRPWSEFFQRHLRPWEHYVPVRRDLSDLQTRLQWVRTHPRRAELIATRALKFAQARLRLSDALSEWRRLLENAAGQGRGGQNPEPVHGQCGEQSHLDGW